MAYIGLDNVNERSIIIAEYIIEHDSTVRGAAKIFGISKSTVHKDITVILGKRNLALAQDVKKVLEKNKNERHIRGGEATKKKYMLLKGKQDKKH